MKLIEWPRGSTARYRYPENISSWHVLTINLWFFSFDIYRNKKGDNYGLWKRVIIEPAPTPQEREK